MFFSPELHSTPGLNLMNYSVLHAKPLHVLPINIFHVIDRLRADLTNDHTLLISGPGWGPTDSGEGAIRRRIMFYPHR